MGSQTTNQSEGIGCLGCAIVFIAEAALLFGSLIMAAFASDSPRATDSEIGRVFLMFFGGPNILAIGVYLIYKYSKKKFN